MTRSEALPGFRLKRLAWTDEELGTIDLPAGPMRLRSSVGSGLTTRPGDPPGIVWAVGDRGPNIKVAALVRRYGLEAMRPFLSLEGAKVMPRLDIGPSIAKLRVGDDRVDLVAAHRIVDDDGVPVVGLPIPAGAQARREPALDLCGKAVPPHPAGFDTEGIAAAGTGGFWIGDEFGPSLLHVDRQGRLVERVVPEGLTIEGAHYPVRPILPAIAAHRHINRGFEALAATGDGQWLLVAFQSPLAHPDVAAHAAARHVRLWWIETSTLRVAGQFAYPLDPPVAFRRDMAQGDPRHGDIKVSELAWVSGRTFLLLERASLGTRIHRVSLDDEHLLPEAHLDPATRPTLEELSAAGALDLPVLDKKLLFDSDRAEDIPADLEGMAILSPTELLLVNDNDFGVEGAETRFWKVIFADPVLA